MKRAAIFLTLIVAGCGNPKSMIGRVLTDEEVQALKTCNERLQSGVGVRLDPVRSEEASFMASGKEISVTWAFPSGGQQMAHVCTTTDGGTRVASEGNTPL